MVLHLICCGHPQDGICVGQFDVCSSDQAVASQILKLKQTLKKKLEVDIYSSDQRVAQESYKSFCTELVDPKQLHIDPTLRDIHFGLWEGEEWNKICEKWPQDLANFSRDWVNNRATSGESFKDVVLRVTPFLSRVKQEIIDGANVLVFSHPSAIRGLLCHVLEIPLSNAYSIKIDYGRLYVLDYDTCKELWQILHSNIPYFEHY